MALIDYKNRSINCKIEHISLLDGLLITTALTAACYIFQPVTVQAQSIIVQGDVTSANPAPQPTDSSWNSGYIGMGNNGPGTLLISGGATVVTDEIFVAPVYTPAAPSVIKVSGAGSRWDVGLNAGSGWTTYIRGPMDLTIEDGGVMTTTGFGFDGMMTSPDPRMMVTVSGAGSLLEVRDWFELAGGTFEESATLLVKNRGEVKIQDGKLGNDGGSGRIIVEGDGSTLTDTGTLTVGYSIGKSSMFIRDGGSVTSKAGVIDLDSQVYVSGAGSVWDVATDLTLGTELNPFFEGVGGYLNVSDGGKVKASIITLNDNGDNRSVVSIGGNIGEQAKAAGELQIDRLELIGEKNILYLNHTDNAFVFGNSGSVLGTEIAGHGVIHAKSGRTIFNDEYSFGGNIIIDPTSGLAPDALNSTLQVNGVFHAATINILPGGTLEGVGLVSRVNNSGFIAPGKTLDASHGGDLSSIGTFTVIGRYTSAGGTLLLDTVLGDDSSLTDKLEIWNGVEGVTTVKVRNIGGQGAQTVNGIEVISLEGEKLGDFVLAGDYVHNGEQAVVAGAYAYKLHYYSLDEIGHYHNWKLDSEYMGRKQYNAGAPVYEVYPQLLLGLNGLSTLQQRVGNRYWNNAGNTLVAQGADATTVFAPVEEAGTHIDGNGVWGRVEGSYTKIKPATSTSDASYDYEAYKMMAGIDGVLNETESGRLIGGLSGHYVHGAASISSQFDADAGRGKIGTDGYGLRGTLTWYDDDGFYADAQAQATWYSSDLSHSGGAVLLESGNHGFGYALSAELGKRMMLDEHWSLTPQAQMIYSDVRFSSFTDRFDTDVSLERGNSLQARLGLSFDYQNSWYDGQGRMTRSNIYGIANLYHEFLGGTRVNVSSERFINKRERLWAGIGIGGSYNWADDKYSLYGEGTINTSLSHFADSYSYKGTAGMRMKW